MSDAVAEEDEAAEASLTVEQLAQASGMTVRNIRNHQTRGLLPPPVVRGRTGFYGQRHIERLRLIQQMQAEGLKLSAIERLLGGDSGWADLFAGLRQAIAVPFTTEEPEIVTLAELEARFGPVSLNAPVLLKSQRLGLLTNLGDGTFEATSPALLRAAEEVVARGVPLKAALSVISKVQRNAQAASEAFVRLFLDELWKPFDAAGQPEEERPKLIESIDRLRPLAVEALLAVFEQSLAAATEEAFGKVLEDQAKRRS
jgi:DNA-binding transcriptional MerR regulator